METNFHLNLEAIKPEKKSARIMVPGIERYQQEKEGSVEELLEKLGGPYLSSLPPIIGRVDRDYRPVFVAMLHTFSYSLS